MGPRNSGRNLECIQQKGNARTIKMWKGWKFQLKKPDGTKAMQRLECSDGPENSGKLSKSEK